MKNKKCALSLFAAAVLMAGCAGQSVPKEDVQKPTDEKTENAGYTCVLEGGEDSNPTFQMMVVQPDPKSDAFAVVGLGKMLNIDANQNFKPGKGWKQVDSDNDEFLMFGTSGMVNDGQTPEEYQKSLIDQGYVCYPQAKEGDKMDEKATAPYLEQRLKDRYSSWLEKNGSTGSDNGNTSSGIRPEFQESMDQYLEFFRKYAEFMKTYSESDDPISMLNEYSEIMSQYTDTMESFDAFEDTEMNDAELKLYLETSAEIQKLLLSVYS